MLNKIRIVENITAHYVVCLGLYRFVYMFNWIYRFYTEGYYYWTQILASIVQTALYADFLYYYF